MSQVYCTLLISMCVKLCQPINTMCQSILHMKCFVEKKTTAITGLDMRSSQDTPHTPFILFRTHSMTFYITTEEHLTYRTIRIFCLR